MNDTGNSTYHIVVAITLWPGNPEKSKLAPRLIDSSGSFSSPIIAVSHVQRKASVHLVIFHSGDPAIKWFQSVLRLVAFEVNYGRFWKTWGDCSGTPNVTRASLGMCFLTLSSQKEVPWFVRQPSSWMYGLRELVGEQAVRQRLVCTKNEVIRGAFESLLVVIASCVYGKKSEMIGSESWLTGFHQ